MSITEQPLPDSPRAAADLLPLVYEQLRHLARQRMSAEHPGHSLQATALVHEAYMRLAGPDGAVAKFANPGHFYAAAAEAMRRILIEHARSRGAVKRGGGARRLNLSTVLDLAAAPESGEILAFDDAISRLENESPDAGKVVRLRFYAGLSVDDTATALGLSARTVEREWVYARAWLYRALRDSDGVV
jgi:RNA polymerase sigma factor (TIGR02999 family)